MEVTEQKPFRISFKKIVYILTIILLLVWGLVIIKAVGEITKSQTDSKSSLASSNAAIFYVSKNGNNSDGRSWTTAWNELDQINWSLVQPGDTIFIDGGSANMRYTTTLRVGKSGVAGSPITIALSPETGRNGRVEIFGGRPNTLFPCRTPVYVTPAPGVELNQGIDLSGMQFIIIDGIHWGGIISHANHFYGLKLDHSSSDITIRNAEFTDNGYMWFNSSANSWDPDMPGVNLSGTNITFDRVLNHDNGQDAFQSGGGIHNITITNSWLYNGRVDPNHPAGDLAWNYCRHSDGIQVYSGGTQSGVTINSSILGPGMMQGTILGQSGNLTAQVDNVTISNTLILNMMNSQIMGYPNIPSQNWTIDHVTTVMDNICSSDNPGCSLTDHDVYLEGAGHHITNSIFYQGRNSSPGNISYGNNCQFNLISGTFQGIVANPQFTNFQSSSPFTIQSLMNGDFTSTNSTCGSGRGSSITSVAQLLGSNPPSPTPSTIPTTSPSVTPINTPIPSNTLIPTPTRTPTPTLTPTRVPTPTLTPTPIREPTLTPRPTNTPTPPEQQHTLITIYASGTPAHNIYPTMELRLNDASLARWTGVGRLGLRAYAFSMPGFVTVGQVKVAFINDANYGRNNDRNMFVDKIILNGITYQSEASTTYSTGGWTQENGCTSGYLRSSWLSCNGYFQF